MWQFSFAFLFAVLFAFIEWDSLRWDPMFVLCAIMGMMGSFGAFFQWKAVAISQTRTALFTFWDDLIAMTLAVLILGEANFLTGPIALGIAISLLSLLLFIAHEWAKKGEEENIRHIPSRFYGHVATYSVVWGIAYFGQRYAAAGGFPVAGFLLAWYSGAVFVAFLIFCFYTDSADDQKDTRPIGAKGMGLVFLLALGIFTSMSFTIPAYKAPQVIVQPIYFVSEMILPILFGLLIFESERRQFDRVNVFYFVLGVIGALIVGLSFRFG